MTSKRTQLADRVLRERGLTSVDGKIRKIIPQSKKTALMMLLEIQHSTTIDQLITGQSIKRVGKALGIDHSTVSKWRKRLDL
ncbi:hypothetical protein LCGC14_1464460 [marine sediment metagenome]|uniref:Uncharacterized protein n=1 Tax=marine sediment metagenome TaxID=412755 RepID=A0A0F9MFY6_9ZZZZ